MSSAEFDKIHDLLIKLRKEAEFCLTRIQELETELSGHVKVSILNTIPDPQRRKAVAKLLEDIQYKQGDSMRTAIEKLEAYILNGDYMDYTTLKVVPNKVIANAFGLEEKRQVSYEKVLGKIPTLFK